MAAADWEQHVLDSERGYVERELHAGVPQETPFLAPQLVRWSDILDVSWHYPYRGGVGYITIRRRGRGRRWLTAVYARDHGPNPLSEGELAGLVESFCDRAQTREQRAARLHERVRSAAETLRTIGVAVLPVGLVLAGVGVALLVQARSVGQIAGGCLFALLGGTLLFFARLLLRSAGAVRATARGGAAATAAQAAG